MFAFVELMVEITFGEGLFPALLVIAGCCLDWLKFSDM